MNKKKGETRILLNVSRAFELAKHVQGIGVVLSNRIVDERNKNGEFKDWEDFRRRVYGVGLKRMKKVGLNLTNSKRTFAF